MRICPAARLPVLVFFPPIIPAEMTDDIPSGTVLLSNSMARVTFDAGERTVALRLLRGDAQRAAFDELKNIFIKMYRGLYDSRGSANRVSMRFDLSACGWVKFEYVREWAQLFRDHRHVTDEVVEDSTVVISNPLTRAAVSGFLALYHTRRSVSVVGPGG